MSLVSLPVEHSGGDELKIDHSSLCVMSLFGATSAALKSPRNNHDCEDKISATVQQG